MRNQLEYIYFQIGIGMNNNVHDVYGYDVYVYDVHVYDVHIYLFFVSVKCVVTSVILLILFPLNS
jgi:hypothetical protein